MDFEKTDVDIPEKRDGDTPLHLAVRIQHEEARNWVVRTLLEAGARALIDCATISRMLTHVLIILISCHLEGADPRIRNKHKELPVESLPADSPLREDM